MNESRPSEDLTNLRAEYAKVCAERDEFRSALYALLWENFTPPTDEELATAEPIGPWFDDLIDRLNKSAGQSNAS
jgi:hypothetical protein